MTSTRNSFWWAPVKVKLVCVPNNRLGLLCKQYALGSLHFVINGNDTHQVHCIVMACLCCAVFRTTDQIHCIRFTVLLWQHNTLGSLYFVMEATCIRFVVLLLQKQDTLGLLHFVMERRHIRFIVFCYGNKTHQVHCILLWKQHTLGSLYCYGLSLIHI